MAELSTEDRQRVWRGIQRYLSNAWEENSLSKAELQAAINSTDVWINNNVASFNSALPPAAQSGLTATQKTLMFVAVALARVNIPLLRKVFGEVD